MFTAPESAAAPPDNAAAAALVAPLAQSSLNDDDDTDVAPPQASDAMLQRLLVDDFFAHDDLPADLLPARPSPVTPASPPLPAGHAVYALAPLPAAGLVAGGAGAELGPVLPLKAEELLPPPAAAASVLFDGGAAGSSAELAPQQMMPSPRAAIRAAAALPDKGGLTLRTGLAPEEETPAGLVDVPAVVEFVSALQRTMLDAKKTLTFLDGGDGESGVLEMFRRQRSAVLRELSPSREASSISGSAFVDGRYFARQLYLPMIETLMMDVSTTDEEVLAVLPPELAVQVEECRRLMAVGGVDEVKREVEALAEAEGERVREDVVRRKVCALLEKNDGADLSPKQRKNVRDSGSSSKSNEKRKKLYDLTRERLEALLVLREDVFDVLYRLFFESNMPKMNAGKQFFPTSSA